MDDFALATPDGELLFCNFLPDAQNFLMSHMQSILSHVQNEELIIQDDNGTSYALMHYEIPNKQLSIIYMHPLGSHVYILYRNTFLMVSILVTASIVCLQIFLTNRWMIKPLYKLASLMHAIEAEDYSVRFHVRGNDEISVVGRQFNHMCEKLQSLYQEVYQNNLKIREAEILTLQAEINPHFMFNTLDIIYWMVNMGKSNEAMKMIRALSDSFRITLYRTNDGFIHSSLFVFLLSFQMRLPDLASILAFGWRTDFSQL